MTDPEYTIEFDGKETYVMRSSVKLAMRRDDRWVSIEPGVTLGRRLCCLRVSLRVGRVSNKKAP